MTDLTGISVVRRGGIRGVEWRCELSRVGVGCFFSSGAGEEEAKALRDGMKYCFFSSGAGEQKRCVLGDAGHVLKRRE